jgi:protein phosphatase 1 regulatory subunit 3A/B/C/D/E
MRRHFQKAIKTDWNCDTRMLMNGAGGDSENRPQLRNSGTTAGESSGPVAAGVQHLLGDTSSSDLKSTSTCPNQQGRNCCCGGDKQSTASGGPIHGDIARSRRSRPDDGDRKREDDDDKEDDGENGGDEDVEFNFRSRSKAPIRRSTSLKASYSGGGSSPQSKKAVRFADAMGLDLVSVRHVLDSIGTRRAASGVVQRREPNGAAARSRAAEARRRRRVLLRPLFAEPSGESSADLLWRVQERKVALEECTLDADALTVSGVVRVANIAYDKRVTVRYSTDNWDTYHDTEAVYLTAASSRYDGGLTDAFAFRMRLPDSLVSGDGKVRGGIVQFSVRYICGEDEMKFWDNNRGVNYCVECSVEESTDEEEDEEAEEEEDRMMTADILSEFV